MHGVAGRFCRRARQQQVEQHGEHAAQADALQREAAEVHAQPADTGHQRDRDDAQVARAGKIDAAIDDRFEANAGNRAEEQHHDAAHDRQRDRLQQRAEFADEGHENLTDRKSVV